VTKIRYGLEQARARLPLLVSDAVAGTSSIITRHGKPCAAVVPLDVLDQLATLKRRALGIQALRGSGRGLWGENSAATVRALRDEWDPQ